jgi:signal recognition particle subunit SRP54
MFEGITERLGTVFRSWRSKGHLTEADVKQGLRQIRLVLLEADVNYKVVKDFIDNVRERALGAEIMRSLSPGQQMIKIVYEELIALLGGAGLEEFRLRTDDVAVLMLCGLQGGGKTTTATKLAVFFRRRGRKPLLAATDVQRPAAIQQLEVLGRQANVPVFQMGERQTPVHIARAAVSHARETNRDLVIIDTAGRLSINEMLMDELREIKAGVQPQETWLVLDAMTGQDAINTAQIFEREVGIDGFVLSKMDGDARGGAAISIRAVTGKPIRFLGIGEKINDLEPFKPEGMASRILGMGDVLSIIERAEAALDEEEMERLEERLRENKFDLNDFRLQMQQVTKLGPLDHLINLVPWIRKPAGVHLEVDEARLKRMEAIISSMTEQERRHPNLLNGQRKRRVARGSGTTVQEVNQLLNQYHQMKKMFQQLAEMEKRGVDLNRAFGLRR